MGMVKRDYYMLQFAEKYQCITASQAKHMFFSKLKSGRREAMARLNMMVDMGKLKKYQSTFNGEMQYYFKKRQTLHQVKLLDYLACIIEKGRQNIYFKPEGAFYKECTIHTQVYNKLLDYRVDAIIEYESNGTKYRDYVEIDNTHPSNGSELIRNKTGYNHDRYEHIATELHLRQYKKARDFLPLEDHLERLIVVKNYLINAHSRVAFHMDAEVHKKYIVQKVDFDMYVYFLPWDLNTFFFPEQAKIVKEVSKVKQAKKVAKNVEMKIEAKIIKNNPVLNMFDIIDMLDTNTDDGLDKDIKLLKGEIKKLSNILYFKNNIIYNI